MHRILLVEDDPDSARITRTYLEYGGYETCVATCLAEARQVVEEQEFDLMLLDMMLPDGSGQQLCTQMRAGGRNCPVVFMTCIDDGDTMVEAFENGADDYVVKPVNYEALLARIKAHLRREEALRGRTAGQNGKLRSFNSFQLDTVRRQVTKDGKAVELSVIEYSLLQYMCENPETLLLYDELYSNVWVNDSLGDVRTVMVHISNLRKKIDPEKKGIIQTVRGAGYVFSDI